MPRASPSSPADMPGPSTMNVLAPASLADFGAAAVDRVLTDPAIKGAVVTSGTSPPSSPAARSRMAGRRGAQPTPRALTRRARGPIYDEFMKLHLLFRKMEKGGKPFVAADQRHRRWASGSRSASPVIAASASMIPRRSSASPNPRSGCCTAAGRGTHVVSRGCSVRSRRCRCCSKAKALSPQQALKSPPSSTRCVAKGRSHRGAAKRWIGGGDTGDAGEAVGQAGLCRARRGSKNAIDVRRPPMRCSASGPSVNYPALDAIQSAVYEGIIVADSMRGLRIEVRLPHKPRSRHDGAEHDRGRTSSTYRRRTSWPAARPRRRASSTAGSESSAPASWAPASTMSDGAGRARDRPRRCRRGGGRAAAARMCESSRTQRLPLGRTTQAAGRCRGRAHPPDRPISSSSAAPASSSRQCSRTVRWA